MNLLFRDVRALLPEGVRRTSVGVAEGKIAFVSDLPPRDFRADRVIVGEELFLTPGFVNAHTHLPMTLFRGAADDRPLQEWLFQEIFPREDRLNDEYAEIGARLAIAESLASGVTSCSDMYFFSEGIARAVCESGIKANLSRSLTSYEAGCDRTNDRRVREQEALIRNWNGADNGRIRTDVSVHAEYVSDPAVWHDLADFAAEHRLVTHVHISETRAEHDACVEKYGKTPTALFAEAGLFRGRLLAAHCVHLSEEDCAVFASQDAVIAHCPVSNAKLASGMAPISDFLSRGIRVALGTDGAASNNSLSMLGEMKTACLVAKLRQGDASALPAAVALRLATENGAYAQGREAECGRILPGMDADLAVFDLSRPNLLPVHDPVSSLVYAADPSDLRMTVVRGRVLYENGEYLTIDMEKLRADVARASLAIG